MNASAAVARKMRDIKITGKEVFTSPYFGTHLQTVITPLCKEYRRAIPRIKVGWVTSKDADAAKTDGKTIYINAACSLVSAQESRAMQYVSILGLLTHELGHYLFTDFVACEATGVHLSRGRWYPNVSFIEGEEADISLADIDMWDWISKNPTKLDALIEVFHNLDNIIEDGYIEECDYIAMNGQLTDGLSLNRQVQLDSMEKVESLRSYLDGTAVRTKEIIDDLLLSYSKYGRFKYDPSNPEDAEFPLLLAVKKVMKYVDACIGEGNSMKRTAGKIKTFLCLWPYYKAALDEDNDAASKSTSSAASSAKASGDTRGATPHESGDGSSEDRPDIRRKTKTGKGSKDKSSSDKKGDSSDDAKSSEDEDSKDHDGEEDKKDSPADGKKTFDGEDDDSDAFSSSDEEFGVPPKALSEIESALRRMTKGAMEEKALEELDKDLEESISDEAHKTDYGGAHTGLTVTVYRPAHSVTPEMISTYNSIAKPYEEIASEMARKLGFLRHTDPDPVSMNGFFTGSRFDASRLVLGDMRYFRQDSVPVPQETVAFSILVDESGSMGGSRIDAARAAALTVYLFTEMCGIKCSVIGHTASFHEAKDLVLDIYADGETIDSYDKYRIINISAQANNRDGAAVTFAGEHLLKRPEKTKVLIVISDGAPLAVKYSGASAVADTAASVKELRRKGVIVFAAAIGSDKPAIQSIYGEGFLDISDIKTLPQQMLGLVKRYVRPK